MWHSIYSLIDQNDTAIYRMFEQIANLSRGVNEQTNKQKIDSNSSYENIRPFREINLYPNYLLFYYFPSSMRHTL